MKCVVVNDTRADFHAGSDLVMRNLLQSLRQIGIEVVAINPVGKHWRENVELLAVIKECDVAIINGEGTIHHDQPTALWLLDFVEYCKEIKIDCYLVNALIQELSEESLKKTKYFKKIFVRDTFSQNYLESHNIQSEFVPDLTFKNSKVQNNTKRVGLLISDSVNEELSMKLYQLSQKHKISFKTMLLNYRLLRPFKFRSILSFIKSRLRFISYFLMSKVGADLSYNKLSFLFRSKSSLNFQNFIHASKGLITGRFHGLCLALKTETPFLVLKSNSYKIEALLSELGEDFEKRLVDIETIQKQSIIKVPEFSKTEREVIRQYLVNANVKMDKMFKAIQENE